MEDMPRRSAPFGATALIAQQAADIVALLHPQGSVLYQESICNVNKVIERYKQGRLITGADFDELKDVTRKLYKVFTAPDTPTAAMLLTTMLAEYAASPQLSFTDDRTWRLVAGDQIRTTWAEQFAAASVMAFAILLAEKDRNPCGVCASLTCRRPYIVPGKGGRRKYCSSRCATRERVAAYRNHLT